MYKHDQRVIGVGWLTVSISLLPRGVGVHLPPHSEALRTVRKHTIGFTNVQSKVLSATENTPLNAAPFVGLTQKFEIAQVSWDE